MTARDMCIVKPHTMTEAMLASSSVLEVAPAAYAAGTPYGAGVYASVAGLLGLITVYKSLQAANLGHAPATSPTWWQALCTLYQAYSGTATYALGERVQDNVAHLVYESQVAGNLGNALTDATKWDKVSATNVWAAFDDEIGTATTGASPLVIVLRPGSTEGLGLLDVVASTGSIVMRDAPGGTVVCTRNLDFDASRIEDVFDWFFRATEFLTSVVLTDLPSQFTDCELTITLNTNNGMAGVGVIKPGEVIDIGNTRMGAKVGIVSRNKLNENKFGNLQVVRIANSKKGSFAVTSDASRFNLIYRLLKQLDGILCIFVGTSTTGYEEMAMYGLFTDFYLVVEYKKKNLCALEVKGGI